MIKNISILVVLVLINITVLAQDSTDKFSIVFLADVKYAQDQRWLSNIMNEWNATGINLRLFRTSIEHRDSNNNQYFNYSDVDSAVNQIYKNHLAIYIRIYMALIDTGWIGKIYNDNDFHTRSDGERYLIPNDQFKRPILNLTSLKSRNDLLLFIKQTIDHFSNYPKAIQKKIKLIVPTFSPFDETEYPFLTYDTKTKSTIWGMLTGFSKPEISAFMNYLTVKYQSIENLNESWGETAHFKSFNENEIKIKEFNWDGIKYNPDSLNYYKFIKGRQDFLDFRRNELKRFIDDCASIIHEKGFRMGIQLGSIYDRNIEFRGFYDPTPIVQNIDQLITDDIIEYYPNFAFSADYSRSLCKYWSWKKNKEITFATETNWPGYNGHTSKTLIKYWSNQLENFYNSGATALFIAHWGTIDSPNKIPEMIKDNSLISEYSAWADTLKLYKNAQIRNVNYDFAFQLSCEQGIHFRNNEMALETGLPVYIHNNGFIYGNDEQKTIWEFPLSKMLKFHDPNLTGNYYNDKGDLVTSYMLLDSPDYVNKNYKRLYLTATSYFIPYPIEINFK